MDEMLLLGIVMVKDYGLLFYVDRLDTLRVGYSIHGCDHSVIDFGMT